jgi:hypothetical protein
MSNSQNNLNGVYFHSFFALKKRTVNGHSSFIMQHIVMYWIPLAKTLLLSRKNYIVLFFANRKNDTTRQELKKGKVFNCTRNLLHFIL